MVSLRIRQLAAAAWVLAALAGPAAAQQGPASLLSPPALPSTLPGGAALPALPPAAQQEILQRIINNAGGVGSLSGGTVPATQQVLPSPATAAAPPPPSQPPAPPQPTMPEERAGSPAEAFFHARAEAGAPLLRQFGYDSLNPPQGNAPVGLSFGALPEDYVVGRDDEVVVAFRGRARASLSARVTRDGLLLLPDLAPIPAAGRTLRDLREELSGRVARELSGSEVFISIGQVRQVSLFVGGEVARPGLQALTAFASVLDALVAAGGVKRTGSLRAIRVEGPNGRRVLDLYPVLAGDGGPTPDLTLREGERLLVPPLGGVVAVGGEVTRPGIYELPPGVAQLPLEQLLALAGEPLRPSGSRFLLQTTETDGRRAYRELSARATVRRGDLLMIQPGADLVADQLRLFGHVTVPVTRAAGARAVSVRALLADPRLVRPDPYPRLGAIWRTDAQTRTRRFLPFDLAEVLAGRNDLPLREGDEVILLALGDVQWLASPGVQQALRGTPPQPNTPPDQQAAPQAAPRPPACPALVALAVAGQAAPQRWAHARGAGFPDIGALPCPGIFNTNPTLLPYLLDQSVLLTGEVRNPGLYPIVDNTGLDQVIAAAGGLSDTADLTSVEFAREPPEQSATRPLTRQLLDLSSRNFAAVRLSPRDAIRFPRGFSDRDLGPVTLLGEFTRPGVYDIRRGERLSEVIARAGGLTAQAFPYGAVFTRQGLRLRQQEGIRRTATLLEQNLVQVASGQALSGLRGPLDLGGAVNAGRQLALSLRNTPALGRMVVEANPVVLASRPELDLLMEPNDLVYMPKRPNEVTVTGAVLNPTSLQFVSGWKAGDYVRAAGGEQRFADGSRAFVLLPNGAAVPAGLGTWQFPGPPVPPGSVVVVPNDPSPYETWQEVRNAMEIASNATSTLAQVATLGLNIETYTSLLPFVRQLGQVTLQ
jgi:protein involved in polysaccharide export with SLBB domain